MATLNLTANVVSSGLTNDSIAMNVLKQATVTTGGLVRETTTGVKASKFALLAHADYADASATNSTYVYLKNVSGNTLNISLIGETGAGNDNHEVSLGVGQWAIFPWRAATADITAYQASSGTTTYEYAVFH